ncbi:encapsidation protein 22K [Goose adenovirus 4]|nr:encapsidation protein 22K [Goose adenovirus 4]
MAQQQVEEYKKRMETEEREIDGESIGSQDTEYADSEEEYEQEYEEGEEVSDSEELFPTPPRPSPIPEEEPQSSTLKRKRRETSTKQLNTKKRRETMGGLFSKKKNDHQTEVENAEKPAKSARKRTAETSKTSDHPNASEVVVQRPKRRSRGNYATWARYRVDIFNALRDAVFNRVIAKKLLKSQGIFIPTSVLAYYSKQIQL